MALNENDMEFLEQVGKQLGPELSSLKASVELASSPELQYLYNTIKEEAGKFSYSLLLTACPKLYPILDADLGLIEELMAMRDTLILYGLARGYEAGKQYAQS